MLDHMILVQCYDPEVLLTEPLTEQGEPKDVS